MKDLRVRLNRSKEPHSTHTLSLSLFLFNKTLILSISGLPPALLLLHPQLSRYLRKLRRRFRQVFRLVRKRSQPLPSLVQVLAQLLHGTHHPLDALCPSLVLLLLLLPLLPLLLDASFDGALSVLLLLLLLDAVEGLVEAAVTYPHLLRRGRGGRGGRRGQGVLAAAA